MRTPSARTTVLTALAVAVPLGVLPASGAESSTPTGVTKQTVNGTIAVPSRFPDTASGSADRGWPGLARRLWVAASPTNGTIAWVFDVDPATYGGAFEIGGVTDRTGAADLDVFFYTEMGDAAGQTPGVTVGEYANPGPGGEKGFVPQGARKAIVYTGNGVGVSFTYTATDVAKVVLGKDALDVTVPAGATLSWVNGTGDYAFVRATQDSRGRRLFDSGSGPASGLAAGEAFSHTFGSKGTFTYETSAGPGVVRVVDGPGVGTPTG